jgi:hypothetical protein
MMDYEKARIATPTIRLFQVIVPNIHAPACVGAMVGQASAVTHSRGAVNAWTPAGN